MTDAGFDNVILITADTFRRDYFERDLCPSLWDLAESGTRFDRAYSTGSGTSSAFPGILASALPLDYGYRGLNERHTPLAEYLSDAGVRTIGVTSSSHASSLFNYHRGFDTFHDDPSYREDSPNEPPLRKAAIYWMKEAAKKNRLTRKIGQSVLGAFRSFDRGSFQYPYERAETVTRKAKDALESLAYADSGESSFAWIHYMEPHSPYYPPDDVLAEFYDGAWTKGEVHDLLMRWYENRQPLWTESNKSFELSSEEVAVLLEFYRAQIRYLDQEVGELIDWLESAGVLDSSLLIFTSDHGEEFFDHGDFGHRQKLYNELINIPFVAYGGRTAVTDEVVSHVDIAPTTCEALGLEPFHDWRGRSLLPLISGESGWEAHDYVISELSHRSIEHGYGGDVRLDDLIIAVIDEDWKFISNRQKGSTELYRTGEAETPENDFVEERCEVAEVYERIVRNRESELEEVSHVREELSPDVRDRLHELGYTGE